jgi:hypothetical protein
MATNGQLVRTALVLREKQSKGILLELKVEPTITTSMNIHGMYLGGSKWILGNH